MGAVETILRARLLQKVNILQQRTVVLLLLKNFDYKLREKKDLIGDFRYVEVFQNCSTKNLNKEPSHFSFFYGAGSDRILGNDKGLGVPVFTNRKITLSETRQSDPERKGNIVLGRQGYIRFCLRRCGRSQ